ncbi:hypothetical protein BDQ17DRAFT_1326806 [Cyathus striatus]|nr:hypothetical protein BDQ17DRAFT_1326806 [Cyathus striatus]
MPTADFDPFIDFEAVLVEQRHLAKRKLRTLQGAVLEKKAEEQKLQRERKMNDRGDRKRQAEEERSKCIETLENEIKDAMEKFTERKKGHPDRYNPHPDGYNYGFGTRWAEDKDTSCSRCTKAEVICWRRVVNSAELYPCLRCKDIRRGCDRGVNATGPVTRQKRARMGARHSNNKDQGMSVMSEGSQLAPGGRPSTPKSEEITVRAQAGQVATPSTMVESSPDLLVSLSASVERIKEVTEANTAALISLADETRRGLAKVIELQEMILDFKKVDMVKTEPVQEEDGQYLRDLTSPAV